MSELLEFNGHKVVTKRGYIVDKNKVGQKKVDEIKSTLTVKPQLMDFGGENESFEVYKENDRYLCIPRFFGVRDFGDPISYKGFNGKKTNFTFKGKPRDIQIPVIEKTVKTLKDKGGGILQLYCGFGKTVLAIAIASILKTKTLVVVHKTSLQNQWYDRIKTFTDAKVGLIRQNKVDIEDKDIVVGMLQSIAMKDYDLSIFDDFGLVICDECFVYKTLVSTDKGYQKIGYLYKRFQSQKPTYVMSYNLTENIFEYKKVTGASKTKKRTVVAKINGRNVECTPEHRFLTADGYKPLVEISPDTPIMSSHTKYSYRLLTDDGEQVVSALYLLGYNFEIKRFNDEKCTFKIVFPKDSSWCMKPKIIDIDYNIWVSNLLRSDTLDITKDTDTFLCDRHIFNKLDILKRLDIRGLSFLLHNSIIDYNFMAKKRDRSSVAYMYLLNLDDLKIVQAKFKENGIECIIKNDLKGDNFLEFSENKEQFTKEICRYFPKFKDHIFSDTIDIKDIPKYEWKLIKDYSYCFIEKLTESGWLTDVYDIEVEDNHNFVLKTGTIVHNCHYFASRVFSRALYKMGSKAMLGLSATPKRNDGLTKILHWYMGDIICKIEREGDKRVTVKFINSFYDDKNYTEKKRYIKGMGLKPNVPIMVNNLIKIKRRNIFIVDCLWEIINQDERKILVLSDRISHLKVLKKRLDKRIEVAEENDTIEKDEITTAMYIGKMKSYELEEAQKASVIFASFSMASVGLDIPDLNTLVLATSKSDVVQCVGRILRKQLEDGDISPLILDISDNLSVFERQGKKRNDYYKKKRYTIDEYFCYNGELTSKERFYKKTFGADVLDIILDDLQDEDYETPDIKNALEIKDEKFD